MTVTITSPAEGLTTEAVSITIEGMVTKDDWEKIVDGELFRLKDLCNVVKRGTAVEYAGNDLGAVKKGARIIHWVPEKSVKCRVYMPDGGIREGYAEEATLNSIGETVQFERFGFTKIYGINGEIVGYFAHR